MKIHLSRHAHKRMTQNRQKDIELSDVYRVARKFKPKVKGPGFTITNNFSSNGKRFDIVIVDSSKYRIIKTIIGH